VSVEQATVEDAALARGELDQAFAAARERHMAGELDEAVRLYRAILERDAGHADALHLLGVAAYQRGRHEQALDLIGQAIARNPDDAKYHNNLGNVLRDSIQLDAAIAAYEAALARDADFADALHNLGTALGETGRVADGIAKLERAATLVPGRAGTFGNLALLHDKAGDRDAAMAAARAAVALAPDDAELQNNIASLLLKVGDAQAALVISDTLIGAGRQVVRALSLKSIALSELGQDAAAAYLTDPTLIDATAIAVPEGYASLEAFNRALVDHVSAHPTLQRAPAAHATVHGWHSGELATDTAPAILALKDAVRAAVARRFAVADADPLHPFWAQRPAQFGLNMWAVVMEQGGHQTTHIHPSGWLSGVYYPELPPDVADADAHAGWIVFGRADDDYYVTSSPQPHLIAPQEGLMVTFPSYYWHRTVPYPSDSRRISIAFDIVPADAAA